MSITALPNDPVALVRQLDAAAIRSRLEDLDRERAALLVLLRAAQRVERDADRLTDKGAGAGSEGEP
jgi:hypothetical protein